MKNLGPKLLIVFFIVVQLVAPAQAMLAAPMMASSSGHKEHCQMHGNNSHANIASAKINSCATHCISKSASDNADDQGALSYCGSDGASCGSSCNNCSHTNMMLLGEFIFMHQTATHSPLQTSYDIFKYYPPLNLRPPRV